MYVAFGSQVGVGKSIDNIRPENERAISNDNDNVHPEPAIKQTFLGVNWAH
jgi:hypothetical protein